MKKVKLIICPTEEKIKILSSMAKDKGFNNTRFMTKNEFFEHYFYKIDISIYYYLMKKYHWNLDVVRAYLSYLPVIHVDTLYTDEKLIFLQELKKELIDNGFIKESNSFHNYLKNCDIEVVGYYDLDLYEERILSATFNYDGTFSGECYEFLTMEDEISFVCLEIRKLINNGIDLSHIYLVNVGEDYYYTINKLFSFYQIPVSIPFRNSLFSTSPITSYLRTGKIPEDASDEIIHKAIQVFNMFAGYSLDDVVVRELMIDKFKHTYLDNPMIKNAVRICDLKSRSFNEDDYVFVVGFNQEVLPSIKKDTDYIEDNLKEKISMYSTSYINQREKKIIAYLLSKIKNLYLSYKKETPFMSYYPASFLMEYSISIIKDYDFSYNYSHFYNKIKLAEKMDIFTIFGEKEKDLEYLYSNYSIPYRSYNHNYSLINQDNYLKNIPYPLNLSYTSLNAYNECRFSYYLKYVLKLDTYEDLFSSFVGSMYHNILSLYREEHFDLEKEYKAYLEKRDLSFKERLLLVRIKKDLIELLEVLKGQQLLTGYDDVLTEKKIEITIPRDVSVKFVGYIDKIMYYKRIEDTYFSIVDYKTGYIDTHLEPLKYGLHMQLPVYLYLIHYGKVFDNPIFTGIYYQNVLFSYPTWSLKLDKELKERYYLQGYSTDNIDELERFDSTYQDSELIKSMKYTDKGFGTYSKILDSNQLLELVDYTKNIIEEKTDSILEADFKIDPKVYNGENISCRYCGFKDICFHKDYDLVYLDKVNDLSFLGGGE